jgi:hypothetical protein
MKREIKFELGINTFAWQSVTCGFKRRSNRTSGCRDIAYLLIDWLGGVLVWEVVDCVDDTFCNATKTYGKHTLQYLTYVFNGGCRSTNSKLNVELCSTRFQPSHAQGSTCNYKKKTRFLAGSPPRPEKPVIPDPMIHATEGDNCNQSHNGYLQFNLIANPTIPMRKSW